MSDLSGDALVRLAQLAELLSRSAPLDEVLCSELAPLLRIEQIFVLRLAHEPCGLQSLIRAELSDGVW